MRRGSNGSGPPAGTEERAREETRVNAQFDDDPEGYLELRAGRQFGRRLARSADFLSEAQPDDLVLEIGAGTGGLLEGLAGARPDLRFLGVEPLPNYVAFARSRWEGRDQDRLRIVEGSAEELNRVVDEPARWIVSHDVLHHVDDIPTVCQRAAKVTTDGCPVAGHRAQPGQPLDVPLLRAHAGVSACSSRGPSSTSPGRPGGRSRTDSASC